MAGHFKNAPIGFKQGMRFKTFRGLREVLAIRDGTAICWPIGEKAPNFTWEYREPTEHMLLDLSRPWIGREYKSDDGRVCEVVLTTDSDVFVRAKNARLHDIYTWDFFKTHFTPVPLEPSFKVGEKEIERILKETKDA